MKICLAFRVAKSVTQAAIKLTTLITKAFHTKHYAAGLFLDLKKDFDTFDHNILLKMLNHMAFTGTADLWHPI